MGGSFSQEAFDAELEKAKAAGGHQSYDVSLGRDFTDASAQARDPRCIWARLNGAPVARIRLGHSVVTRDLVTLFDAAGGETAHDVTQSDATGRLEMERHALGGAAANETHPSFSALRIFFGDHKWRLAAVAAARSRGGRLCSASVLVVEDHAKGASVDPKKIVGFISVRDFAVADFVLSNRFTPILVAAVLYVLTRVCNGAIRVPGEKKLSA